VCLLFREVIKKAEKLGVKAIFLTVDLPHAGKREKDMKIKLEADLDRLKEEEEIEIKAYNQKDADFAVNKGEVSFRFC